MKKLLLVLFFLNQIASFGQQIKELNSQYFLNLAKFENGSGVLEILEYTNYDLHQKFKEARKNNKRLSVEEESKAFENKVFKSEEAKYFLNNEEENQKIWFSSNSKGEFVGIAEAKIPDYDSKLNHYTFRFQNGKLATTEVKDDLGKVIKTYEINDSILITKGYKDNKIEFESILKKNKKYPNSIVINYFENGKVKSEDDYISNVTKTYNEKGLPKSYKNYETDEQIEYDEMGKKLKRSYKTKEEQCYELYTKGIITQRTCRNKNNTKDVEYSFKDGQLDYYFVTENNELKKYDRNHKLLKTEKVTRNSIYVP
ncbi:hypothetical protein [Soonwooa sp.]|uniref:hypothetical protein n=1 Tax=Soonwooa sp. TaxID=1938592 RepID=UPI00262F6C2E|nr:hypothetical protein [Soonwooa sp.]